MDVAEPASQAEHDDEKLPGTMFVVLVIAAIMVIVWVAVFLVFLSRY